MKTVTPRKIDIADKTVVENLTDLIAQGTSKEVTDQEVEERLKGRDLPGNAGQEGYTLEDLNIYMRDYWREHGERKSFCDHVRMIPETTRFSGKHTGYQNQVFIKGEIHCTKEGDKMLYKDTEGVGFKPCSFKNVETKGSTLIISCRRGTINRTYKLL
jgi:hypothetical protein